MKKLLTKLIIISVIFLILPLYTNAHPGRTNRSGCHICRTNCTEKWGLEYKEYHCHAKKVKKARKSVRKKARRY